ncbi:MAG: YggS family pyridoxal phosphate-dependent enzyme [Cytophagaceae bacterium]|nr:YggS family pyridoxal phosphate-dependent enzyme [Cytophagaceae bacterium]
MGLESNIRNFETELQGSDCKLIAVSKTYPAGIILEAYQLGLKVFGENKVQELVPKYEALPKDIEWHLIGHLQSNKVKYIAPFIYLIHSVDSMKLLTEINKQAEKNNRTINCLLQIFIASEETKFGLSFEEAKTLIESPELDQLKNIRIVGMMGMASNSEDENKVRKEFKSLKAFFEECKGIKKSNVEMKELSMGMSSDYKIAIEEGSTMVRVGSAIFGKRS